MFDARCWTRQVKGDFIRIIDIEGAWRFTPKTFHHRAVYLRHLFTDLGGASRTAVVGECGGDENAIGIRVLVLLLIQKQSHIWYTGSAGAIEAPDELRPELF